MTTVSDWQIVIVRHGTRAATRAEMFLEPDRPEAPQQIDYYFWVVRNDAEQVVVDTGFSAAAAAQRSRTMTCDPADALAALGITAAWTGDVVLTHAHWDHTGGIGGLAGARLVLHRAEYDFWRSGAARRPEVRALIDEGDLAALSAADRAGRLRLVDPAAGDPAGCELRPGIHLIHAPGHTPGQLMVTVRTSSGTVLLTSDAVHFDEELARRMPFRHMTDLSAAHRIYDLIDSLTRDGRVDNVITGHEPEGLERFPRLPGVLERHAAVCGAPTGPVPAGQFTTGGPYT